MDTAAEQRQDRIQYVMAQQEIERRARSAPLIYYKPHPGQVRFHDAIKRKRITLVTSGNRFGKSHANAAETIAWCYGYRPWEVPGLKLDEDGDYPPRSTIAPEYWIRRPDGLPISLPAKIQSLTGLAAKQGIQGTMWPKIDSLLPPAVRSHPNFQVLRGAFSVPVSCKLPNGSEIHFGSGEQDVMQFEGQDFTALAFDEPFKRAIWGGVWRGLIDRLGRVWGTCTPVGPNAPWIFQEFIAPDRDDVANVTGSIHENPHITPDAVDDFLNSGGFTDEERQAREKGTWQFLTHLAFPMFDPDVHVVPPHEIPPGAARGMAIDPAHRRPFAIAWSYFTEDGDMCIYDEYPSEDHSRMRTSFLTVPDYKKVIIAKENGDHMDFRCMDPRFGAASPRIKGEVHTSIQEDFAAEGMYIDCRLDGTEREETGIERLRQGLRWDRSQPLSPLNRPKIRIVNTCHNMIAAFAMSNFMPPVARDPDLLPEKLAEKFKDFRDVARYLRLYPFLAPWMLAHDYSYINQVDLERENDDSEWGF
ncbi:MAG: hypothetical protein V3S83_12345 [Gemmatimonadota bacterium]